jgi:hypothetical protein
MMIDAGWYGVDQGLVRGAYKVPISFLYPPYILSLCSASVFFICAFLSIVVFP